jgi:STE24 endopeptidase
MPLLLALVLVIMFATPDVVPWLVATSAGRLGAALLVMLVPAVFAWLSAASIARGVRHGRLDDQAATRRLRWAMWLHLIVWCASVAVLAIVVGWSHLVRSDWGLAAWPVVDEWLMLVPIVVPIVCGWLAFYEVDQALSARYGGAIQRSRWTYVGQRLRGELLLLLLPVVVIVTLADLATWWEIPRAGSVASGLMGAMAVAAVAVLYPWLLRACWRATRLPDGPVREQLEAALARWNLRVSDIMVWPTDGRMANAAVAGLVPSLRYVFLTDALVKHFSPKELEAVLAHEMGHLRHRHLFLRLMAMFVPLAAWPLLWATGMIAHPLAGGTLGVATIGSDLSATAWLPAVGIGTLLVVYMATIWAGYSRLLEREADLFACACLPRSGGRDRGSGERAGPDDHVERFVAVLEKLAISNGIEISEHQWQHGSVLRRAAFLRRVGRDDARVDRFHARLARLATVVVALGAVGAMCCVV